MESQPSPPPASDLASGPPPYRRWPVRTMFLSWFGLGLVGPAPGTLGSAGCIPLAAIIVWIWGQNALFSAATVVFLLGWVLTALHLRDVAHDKDPQWIVIDEVAAQWAVLAVA